MTWRQYFTINSQGDFDPIRTRFGTRDLDGAGHNVQTLRTEGAWIGEDKSPVEP